MRDGAVTLHPPDGSPAPTRAMVTAARSPVIFGSSNASHRYAPNSVPALRATLSTGVDGLVVDVEMTRDGVLVACDDRLLRASCPSLHAAREASWPQLSSVEFGLGTGDDRTPVSALEDVLEEFAGWCDIVLRPPLFIQEEAPRRAQLMAERLGEALAWVHDGVWVISESLPMLGMVAGAADVSTIYRCLEPQLPWGAEIDSELVSAVAVAAPSLRPSDRVAADAAGVGIFALDCDTPGAVARAQDADPDGFVTERPAWLRAWLGRNRGRGASVGAVKPQIH